MNFSNQSAQSEPSVDPKLASTDAPPSTSGNSMDEFYQLQRTLLLLTLGMTGVIFWPVWILFSLNTALNYLLGASVGAIYLRLLGKEVEQLSSSKERVGSRGLAVFAGLIIVASQWQQLHILPVFLGFLTYKTAITIYVLKTVTSVQK